MYNEFEHSVSDSFTIGNSASGSNADEFAATVARTDAGNDVTSNDAAANALAANNAGTHADSSNDADAVSVARNTAANDNTSVATNARDNTTATVSIARTNVCFTAIPRAAKNGLGAVPNFNVS